MDDLQRLIAIEDIKALRARYQRSIDSGAWEAFGQCLHPDIVVQRRGLDQPLVGRDTVIARTRPSFEAGRGRRHLVAMPEIEITSDTTARGTWTVIAYDGIYEDEYVKLDGRWVIRSIRIWSSDEDVKSIMASPSE